MARAIEACGPTSLPFRATYHGQFQPDLLRVLRRLPLRFQLPTSHVVQGLLQGVRPAVAAHCAHTILLSLQAKFASGFDYLYGPLVYGYLLPA